MEETEEKMHNKDSKKFDEGLSAFITIARFHGINADPEQICHNIALYGRIMEEIDILHVAKQFKLKAKATQISIEYMKKMRFPLIAESKEGGFLIVAQVQEEKLLVLYPGKSTPEVIKKEHFVEIWNNRIILFTTRETIHKNQEFGLKWFLPSIV